MGKINAVITGVGGYVPDYILNNEELSRMVDTTDEWITTRVGIKERHILTEEGLGTSYLARKAAKQLIQKTGVDPDTIDALIVTTTTPDYKFPSTASIVLGKLGLKNAFAFDFSAACCGFLYTLDVAASMIQSGRYKKIIVIGADKMSSLVDYTDRATCVLFGDGAGAAIFELCDAPFAITLGARGDEAIHAGGPCRTGSAPISMDGRAVFRFAVDALPRCLHAVLDETQLALDDVDWVVCHQANSRIIDHCVKALHADAAKFYKNMDRHGNTSAASIPVALNEMAEAGLLKAGQKVSCIGFGGGLTWGGMLVTYSPLSHS